MEQLALLLLFGAIAFIQWLVKKSAEARAQRKREQHAQWQEEQDVFREARGIEPPAPAQTGDQDASMRRLMEALGLPQDSAPPPLPQRRAEPPPLPQAPAPKPPAGTLPKLAERPAPKVPEKAVHRLPEKPPVHVAKLSAPPAKSSHYGLAPEKKPDFSIRELLASPDSMKKAVILSEIIGAPKALRS